MPPRLCLLLCLALAACQPLPHPFEDDRPPPHAPILTVSDSFGVLVEPVAEAPALAPAMVAALQALEVPASTTVANRSSYRLSGSATRAADGRTSVAWSLRAADGKPVGSDSEQAVVPQEQWDAGEGPALAQLTQPAAKKLGDLIQEPVAVEHKPPHLVHVARVEGAPGNGGTALPDALRYLLKQRSIETTGDSQSPDTIGIAGTVAIAAAGADKDHVTITWRVLKPDGTEVGQIRQENDVPRGALDGRWGDVAMAIAQAAIDDVIRVIGMVPPKA